MTAVETSERQAAVERQAARAKALGHPLRFQIFAILSHREASPTELAEELGEDRETVAYHVRYLAGLLRHSPDPLIELVDTDQRRGGTQHFYRAIGSHWITMEASEKLPLSVREDLSAVAVERIVTDLLGAQRDGTLDSHPQRTLMQSRDLVDDKGMREIAKSAEEHQARVEDAFANSKARIAESEEEAMVIVSGILAFEVSPDAP